MADNINVLPSTDPTAVPVATDQVMINAVAVQVPWGKLGYGSDGTFTAVTPSAGLPVLVSALPATPAGTNLIGQVAAGQQTNQIMNGTTALTPRFARIVASASGATTVVAAVTSKRIRVLKFSFSA